MCISSPSIPAMPPPPPPPPAARPEANKQVRDAVEKERKRLAASVGREDTILTGGRGLLTRAANTVRPSLLGG